MVGSADVKALYPSLDVEFTVDKMCDVFDTSGINVEGTVDADELGLYLSLNYDEHYLRSKDILQYCPRRKSNRGRQPTITSCGMEDKKEKRFSRWVFAASHPNVAVTRRMFIEAFRIVLLFIMKNHVYTFNGVIYRQLKGGPIGMVLAQIFMIWWDRRFKDTAHTMGLQLHMYKRYVDDINIVMSVPAPEVTFRDVGIRVAGDVQDSNERCMQIVKAIADGIHPSIKVEVDHPSNHDDGKIPILDVKVWVEERDMEVNGICVKTKVIMHEFYSKDISSKSVIYPRSAIPQKVKRSIMTREVFRI